LSIAFILGLVFKCTVNTDNHANEILKQVSNSLHGWVQPNLPEDLSFIKNHTPWLIDTSHEYESYIENEDEEEIYKILKIKGLHWTFLNR
jgi:hypothetical protein